MLCDDIAALARTPADRNLAGAFSRLAAGIRQAQRFVLDAGASAALSEVADSKPSSLAAAIPLCRNPFPTIWVEWASPDRPPREGNARTERVGALIRSHPTRPDVLRADVAWSFPPPLLPLHVSPIAILLHMGEDPDAFSAFDSRGLISPCDLPRIFSGAWRAVDRSPIERAALAELDARWRLWEVPLARHLILKAPVGERERLAHAMVQDALTEPQAITAALALLNSRNCVSIDPCPDQWRENRSRMRQGKKKLISYSTVRLSLSAAQERQARAAGATAEELRRHIVRGHFKVRRSGIYWWRPFFRGNPEIGTVIREGYEVTA